VLVTVSAFREPYEAHLFRGRLEAEGVTAFVAHEWNVANAWHRSVSLGGVKVQVSSDQYETAREIERACCRGDYRDVLRDEVGDLDDPVCPHCGGTEYRKRRPFLRAAVAVALSMTTACVVPPLGWILRCETCLKEYWAPHRPLTLAKCLLVAALMVGVALGVLIVLHWLHSAFGCSPEHDCL
jgi:hypothetical protein